MTPAAGLLLLAIPVLLQPIFEAELDRSNLDRFAPQLAAQVQVESAWRPEARSKYAAGLAQFTPPTWGDVAPATVPSCADQPETDPACSLRAQHLYMRQLMRLFGDSPARDRWAFTWASYNGGYGWIRREKYRCSLAVGCDPRRWWGHVARHCIRADWACTENRAYPDKILRAMPAFMTTGVPQ